MRLSFPAVHHARQESSDLAHSVTCQAWPCAWPPPGLHVFAASRLGLVLLTLAHVFPWAPFCPELKALSLNTTVSSELGCMRRVPVRGWSPSSRFPARSPARMRPPEPCGHPAPASVCSVAVYCLLVVRRVLRRVWGPEGAGPLRGIQSCSHEPVDSPRSGLFRCRCSMCSGKGFEYVLLESFLIIVFFVSIINSISLKWNCFYI